MFVHRRFLVVLLVAGAACAQKTASTSTVAPQGSTRARKNSDVITQDELRDPTIAGVDAMTAIRQLRPAFFRTRGPMSSKPASRNIDRVPWYRVLTCLRSPSVSVG